MELLEGQTLEQLVDARGSLPPHEVVNYLGQVASGLDKAHGYKTKEGVAQPIVHRDLKPENLFLARRDNGEPLVKILDFGIAKVLSKDASRGTQQPKGTPLYMAPEQLSLTPITPATDLWALGLIAFRLLTGKSYWLSANQEESTIYMLFAEIGSPRETASRRAQALGSQIALPPAFDAWFAQCTASDPAARFTTATAAILALGAAFEIPPPRQSLGDPGALPAPPQQPASPVVSARTAEPDASSPQKSGQKTRSFAISPLQSALGTFGLIVIAAIALRARENTRQPTEDTAPVVSGSVPADSVSPPASSAIPAVSAPATTTSPAATASLATNARSKPAGSSAVRGAGTSTTKTEPKSPAKAKFDALND
jgi:serine/threonine-protein kinase